MSHSKGVTLAPHNPWGPNLRPRGAQACPSVPGMHSQGGRGQDARPSPQHLYPLEYPVGVE